MKMVNRKEALPKYKTIIKEIRDRIRSGTYKPGEMLPSERALARELHTNHETVNKAISNLVATGVLYRKRGIGTFINSKAIPSASMFPRNRVDLVMFNTAEELFHTNVFHEEIMFFLQNLLTQRGFTSHITPAKDLPDFSNYLATVDALITVGYLPLRLIKVVIEASIPLICFNFEYTAKKVSSLLVDDNAVDELIETLVRKGHRRIGYVHGPGVNFAFERRKLRFVRYMQLLEFEDNLNRVYSVDPNDENLIGQFVKKISDCTALVISDDFLAIQVLQILTRFNLSVPKDVSLTGFGNLSITSQLFPSLVTTDVDREALCQALVEEISALIESEKTGSRIVFPSHLVSGDSIADIRS